MSDEEYDLLMKIIVVGDSGVGKTNLVNRFTQQTFLDDSKPTVGVEFFSRTLDIQGKTIKAQVWDTAGQEKFRSITHAYYRGAVGAMICYDITKESTFNNVDKWIDELSEHADRDIIIMLVGTKSDLESRRVVRSQEGEEKAKHKKYAFLETSSLKATNVVKAFSLLLEEIYNQLNNKINAYEKKRESKTSLPATIQIINTNNTPQENKNVNKKQKCC